MVNASLCFVRAEYSTEERPNPLCLELIAKAKLLLEKNPLAQHRPVIQTTELLSTATTIGMNLDGSGKVMTSEVHITNRSTETSNRPTDNENLEMSVQDQLVSK